MKVGRVLALGFLMVALGFALTGCLSWFNQPPVARFNAFPTEGAPPLTVFFDASKSYDPDGTIGRYAWNFGDGDHGQGMTVDHTYDREGNYTVKLIVTDDKGKTDWDTKSISVVAPKVPLTILHWEAKKDDWNVWAEGEARNTSGHKLSYCEIWAYFYDANGARISEWLDNVLNLRTDETWAFKIYCMECFGEPEKVDHVSVKVGTCQ